jgi:transcription initiation factor IIE alpha subunit
MLNKEELKEVIQAVYDDYDFADFNLHFVDEVEPHNVYEIKNNRILNKLKETTLISVSSLVTREEIINLRLYGIDVNTQIIRKMIEESANKIVSDIYKVNGKDWFYNKTKVDIELTITNWKINVEETESRFRYILNFEIA